MKTTITKLVENPSKEEEINFLNEVAESIPSWSYLANLFSPKMVTWVKEQIRNDFTADLFEWYEDCGKDVELGHNEIERLHKELASYEIALADKDAEIKILKEEAVRLAANCRQYEMDLGDAIGLMEAKQAIIEARDIEIVTLKAKLYDLMSK